MFGRVKSRGGFTVLELFTTMAMAGVLVAVTMPATVKVLDSAKVVSAKRQFKSAHAMAKAAARRYRRIAELHIDQSSGEFWVEVDTGLVAGTKTKLSGKRNSNSGKKTGQQSEGSVTMTSNRSLVCFDPRGVASTEGSCEAGDLLVTFAVGGRVDTVMTTALGKTLNRETASALTAQ